MTISMHKASAPVFLRMLGNLDQLLAKAKSRGLVGADEKLAPEEIDQLIFAAGLSTAEVADLVDDRGLGGSGARRLGSDDRWFRHAGRRPASSSRRRGCGRVSEPLHRQRLRAGDPIAGPFSVVRWTGLKHARSTGLAARAQPNAC